MLLVDTLINMALQEIYPVVISYINLASCTSCLVIGLFIIILHFSVSFYMQQFHGLHLKSRSHFGLFPNCHVNHIRDLTQFEVKIWLIENKLLVCHKCIKEEKVIKISLDFQAIVSEEDGMESMAHRFLSAAVKVCWGVSLIIHLKVLCACLPLWLHLENMKFGVWHNACVGDWPDRFWYLYWSTWSIFLQLDRKPSKCVVFEDDPRAITAAHNCTMMAVGLIGAHRAWVFKFQPLYFSMAEWPKMCFVNIICNSEMQVWSSPGWFSSR